jgi:cell division protein FtsB
MGDVYSLIPKRQLERGHHMSGPRQYPYRDQKKAASPVKKYIGRAVLIGGLLVLVYFYLFGDYGVQRIRKQKQEIAELERTVEQLRQQQQELKETIELLKTDPEYIEKIAREEYGLVKQGEIIYKVVPPAQEDRAEEKDIGDGETRK